MAPFTVVVANRQARAGPDPGRGGTVARARYGIRSIPGSGQLRSKYASVGA
jgi:hypothetical protein